MIIPATEDFIDIHNHNVTSEEGIFSIDNIMVHEERFPDALSGQVYSAGIHPWYLNEKDYDVLIEKVITFSGLDSVIAVGEAGFDRIKGPSVELQRKAFEAQVLVSEEKRKPVVIHNVKGWEELLSVHKKMRPSNPWIIHGFHGKPELAEQLLSRGFYLSLWPSFVQNQYSSALIRSVPASKLFLETDGSNISISEIYYKVSGYLNMPLDELKKIIYENFMSVFSGR